MEMQLRKNSFFFFKVKDVILVFEELQFSWVDNKTYQQGKMIKSQSNWDRFWAACKVLEM